MNSNSQPFFDLAMKVIAGQANAAEQAELNALLLNNPALKAEFERLKMDAELAKELAPLLDATEATTGSMPAYARERLQTKVRQTLGKAKPVEKRAGLWRWWVGLATATAAVVVVVINRPAINPNLPAVIQVAMLDSVGTVRGTGEKPMDTLQRQWNAAKPQEFDDAAKLKRWQEEWPAGAKQTVVKILYNRDTSELRVLVRSKEGTVSEKVIVVTEARELPKALIEAEPFIREKTR